MVFPNFLMADSHPVINEFLPHPSTGNKEWVEIYVPEGMDITNYWIDDDTDFTSDSGNSSKKQMTTFIQGSDSKHVVYELSSSMFNNDGDTVALFAPDGALVDHYTYTSDPGVDISIGRTPDGTGDFQVLASATQGSPNSPPLPTATATPAPTDKPTYSPSPVHSKEPKPTDTPKPVKSTFVPTSSSIKNILASTVTSVKNNFLVPTKTASNGAYPTSILGVSTKSAERKKTPIPTTPVLISNASLVLTRIIAISTGGLLLLGCGILIYLKKKNAH